MSVTLTLNDELVRRLQAQAQIHNLSVEQWVLAILTNVSERPDHPETWTDINARRLALIRKRYEAGLNPSAENELQSLQDAAATVFAPTDQRRLAHVKSLVQGDRPTTDD
jgi:plasmid stability protein